MKIERCFLLLLYLCFLNSLSSLTSLTPILKSSVKCRKSGNFVEHISNSVVLMRVFCVPKQLIKKSCSSFMSKHQVCCFLWRKNGSEGEGKKRKMGKGQALHYACEWDWGAIIIKPVKSSTIKHARTTAAYPLSSLKSFYHNFLPSYPLTFLPL